MSSISLNNDVLLSILSVSPPKTATSIMATCSFLYHEGAKIILQDPVELMGSEENALAILRFIQAEDLSRCPHVRILTITMLPVSESVAWILANLVPRMTGLKELTIGGELEQMFESYPYLLPTFAGLRSLKVLIMIHVGERCAEMIKTLQSELDYACVHFLPTAPLDLSLAVASNPMLMLMQSASTLKQILCSHVVDTNPALTFSSPTPAIYPQLRTLCFLRQLPPNPIPFMRAFPNLIHFRVIYDELIFEEVDLESYRPNRELILSLQRPSRAGEPFGWRRLQEFTGHTADLWVLALACRIPHVNLEDAPSARFPFLLTDALAYARPIRLTITFENHSLTNVLGGGFVPALLSEGASNLTSLAFIIDLTADDRNLNVGHALNILGSALSVLKLCDLLFAVRDIGLSETAATAPPTPTASDTVGRSQSTPTSPTQTCATYEAEDQYPPLNVGERTLNDIDVLLFVQHLVAVVPTIQNIVVAIEQPRRCGGALRVGYSAKCKYGWVVPMYTGDTIVYKEASGVHYDRAMWMSVIKGWNAHMAGGDIMTRVLPPL